ncbi:hypothetical protein [Actinoplanes sp. NPDC051411]|uniref:hypothetical protein n=1 Tax=Actinoplanes sp. NPDC051411 TaxID=3155522 RepID=UPI0034416389
MNRTLEERLKWVEHKARLHEGFAEVVDRDLSKLVETTKGVLRTLETHTKALERHDQILESHSRALNRIDQKVAGVDEKVTVLDQKITAMDEKFERRFVGLEVKVTAMDEKVDLVLRALTGRGEPVVPSARVAID